MRARNGIGWVENWFFRDYGILRSRFSGELPIAQVDMLVETQNSEVVLTRFNKLLAELVRGTMNRNTFQPWEIEILLDIEACNLRDGVKKETLRRYQKAVTRAMEKGAPTPFRLSEYLNGKKSASLKQKSA